MKRVTLPLLMLLAGALAVAAPATPTATPQGQTICPVTGEKLTKGTASPHVDFQGQRIYFSSAKAADEFRKDPEPILAKGLGLGLKFENIQTTCPVSGEKLGEGDMGKPVAYSFKGRTVMFCCKSCIAKFEKDPVKYLAALPGEKLGTK